MIGSQHNEPAIHSNGSETPESLLNFAMMMEDSKASVPDVLIANYLQSAGFECTDPRLIRLLSLAGQKFIAEIVSDALQHYRAKSFGPNKKQNKDKKAVLTMEELTPALADHWITAVKPPYYL